MKSLCLSLVLLFFLLACQKNENESSSLSVIAYYVPTDLPDEFEHLPLKQLTHIIFSFTQVIDNKMQFTNEKSADVLRELVKQKEKYPHLKVMVACGGWGGSGGFSEMAASTETRTKFVESVSEFVREFKIDGIDYDWEYPGLPGAGNPYQPEDKENFTSLIKETRMALDDIRAGLVLSFASAGWEAYYEHVELDKVMPYVDYMNIMTYDQVGGGSPFTGHHTNLGKLTRDDLKGTPVEAYLAKYPDSDHPRSAEHIINFCIEKGVEARQLVIGAAFYCRAWKGVAPENNGLYQPTRGFLGAYGYTEIRQRFQYNHDHYIKFWDDLAKAPYLYSAVDSVFVSYDDTISVRLKTEYAKNNGLGGIMFWELKHDSPAYELLMAIYKETLRK